MGQCQLLFRMISLTLVFLGMAESYITLSLMASRMGPIGGQLSYHREVSLSSPIDHLKRGRKIGLSLTSFLHVHEAKLGGFISHRERPLRRFALAHNAQLDVVWGWQRFHRCFPIAATFQTCNFLMPRPPSSYGNVKSSQATFEPLIEKFGPFQRNLLMICSTWFITFFVFQRNC